MLQKLIKVQAELKAPKNQRNNFGGYNYRSAEDILEAVKPILAENKTVLIIKDEINQIGERYYVKATATLYGDDGKEIASTSAFAREEENKKGQDGSQITGATSSYARKYALNGLFAIDDTKDADVTNTHGKEAKEIKKQEPVKSAADELFSPEQETVINADFDIIEEMKSKVDKKNLTLFYNAHKEVVKDRNKFYKTYQDCFKKLMQKGA